MDGTTRDFEAPVATGIGGLYTVKIKGSTVKGTSGRGNKLLVRFERIPEADFDGKPLEYSGSITTDEGKERIEGLFEAAKKGKAYDEFRNVVLDSGLSRGNRTSRAKAGHGHALDRPHSRAVTPCP